MFRFVEKNTPLASILCAVFSTSATYTASVPQDVWALASIVLFASNIVSQYAAFKRPKTK